MAQSDALHVSHARRNIVAFRSFAPTRSSAGRLVELVGDGRGIFRLSDLVGVADETTHSQL
jgi:hypothetical protein